MKIPAVIYTPSFFSVTFVEEGRPVLVTSGDKRYERCLELYKREDYEGLHDFLFVDKAVQKISNGDLVVEDDQILYKGEPVHNVVVGRIFDAIDNKLPYSHLMAFLKNILECDSYTMLNELYLFLESNESMPIMQDGSFLAYRVVDSEYMSKHPNPDGSKNRNFVGDIVTEKRQNVDPDRNRTCSKGLHFCSYSYIPHYGYENQDKVMVVKIFPQDVIAIPNDYNNSKGRCCKYEVIAEVENYGSDDFENRAKDQINDLAYDYEDEEDDWYEDDTEGEEYDSYDYDEDVKHHEDMKPFYVDNNSEEINDEMQYVKSIIDRQLTGYDYTTARRVSKSTKPYISIDKVIKYAIDLGYNIFDDVDSKSDVEISKFRNQ